MYGARVGARSGRRAGYRSGPGPAARAMGAGKRWSKSKNAWVARRSTGTGLNNMSLFQPSAHAEQKYLDLAVTAYAVNTTGTVQLINGCSQGDGEQNRTGNKITMTSISIRGVLEANAATQVEGEAVILLMMDIHSNTGTPGISEIFNESVPTAYSSRINGSRFHTIRRWFMPYGVQAAIGGTNATLLPKGNNQTLVVDETIKVNLPTHFTGSGGTVSAVISGAIFLVCLGDVAAGTGAVSFVASTRCRFLDA